MCWYTFKINQSIKQASKHTFSYMKCHEKLREMSKYRVSPVSLQDHSSKMKPPPKKPQKQNKKDYLLLQSIIPCGRYLVTGVTQNVCSAIGCGYRIHWQQRRKDIPTPTSVLDMTPNYLLLRIHSWNFGKCGVPLHCHYSQVHSDPVW